MPRKGRYQNLLHPLHLRTLQQSPHIYPRHKTPKFRNFFLMLSLSHHHHQPHHHLLHHPHLRLLNAKAVGSSQPHQPHNLVLFHHLRHTHTVGDYSRHRGLHRLHHNQAEGAPSESHESPTRHHILWSGQPTYDTSHHWDQSWERQYKGACKFLRHGVHPQLPGAEHCDFDGGSLRHQSQPVSGAQLCGPVPIHTS